MRAMVGGGLGDGDSDGAGAIVVLVVLGSDRSRSVETLQRAPTLQSFQSSSRPAALQWEALAWAAG